MAASRFDGLRTNVKGGWQTIKRQKSQEPVSSARDSIGRPAFSSGSYTAVGSALEYHGSPTRLHVTDSMSKGIRADHGAQVVPKRGRLVIGQSDADMGRSAHFHAAVNAAADYAKQQKKHQDPWLGRNRSTPPLP